MSETNYYDILDVARSASGAEIKRAYRKLAKQFHPDVNTDPDAARRFSEIDAAHDVLIDPDSRRRYNLSLPPEEAYRQGDPPGDQDYHTQGMQGTHGTPPNQYANEWIQQPPGSPNRTMKSKTPAKLTMVISIVIIITLGVFRLYYRTTGRLPKPDNLGTILLFVGVIGAAWT